MIAYYNEVDPYAAAWLENLIRAGHISFGIVDTRSIEDVFPEDLRGFDRCHFFAGIGVWDYALNLAGWPEDRPVWTGSCPCQPFSTAGKGRGFADERHLWPAWHHLIRECRPAEVLGEQAANKGGALWLDLVQTDLEADDYAVGPVVLPAAGVGAPHGRHRTWFVGHTNSAAVRRNAGTTSRAQASGSRARYPNGGNRGDELIASGTARSFWSDADWIACRDGKVRPVEPGTFPLAHGAPARMGRLRAYGNALCAEAAKAFIDAVLQCES